MTDEKIETWRQLGSQLLELRARAFAESEAMRAAIRAHDYLEWDKHSRARADLRETISRVEAEREAFRPDDPRIYREA